MIDLGYLQRLRRTDNDALAIINVCAMKISTAHFCGNLHCTYINKARITRVPDLQGRVVFRINT